MMTRIVTAAVAACALCGFAADFQIETDTFALTCVTAPGCLKLTDKYTVVGSYEPEKKNSLLYESEAEELAGRARAIGRKYDIITA